MFCLLWLAFDELKNHKKDRIHFLWYYKGTFLGPQNMKDLNSKK